MFGRPWDANGISYYELGDVKPNPRLSYCKECIEKVHQDPVDFILAVGGGSVMDTAKFIAVQANMKESLFVNRDIFTPDPVIPHGVISTLGGTGSEQSLCAMVVDDSLEVPEKVGLYNLGFFFDFCNHQSGICLYPAAEDDGLRRYGYHVPLLGSILCPHQWK